MKRRVILMAACAVFVTGCGTFQLGQTVPKGQTTPQQHQLDQLSCKDQAHLAANSTERQTGNFLLGMTIVGAPLAFELEKKKQREVFKDCMESKGYTVIPPSQ